MTMVLGVMFNIIYLHYDTIREWSSQWYGIVCLVLDYCMSLYKDGKTVMEVDSNTISNLLFVRLTCFLFFQFSF